MSVKTTIHVADARRFTYKDALEAADMDLDNIFYVRNGEALPDGPANAAGEEDWIVSVFVPYLGLDYILHAQAWDHYAWIAK